MNTIRILLVSFIMARFATPETVSGGGNQAESRVQTTNGGIEMEVWCAASFVSNRDIKINYSLSNQSADSYKIVASDAITDVAMNLTGPDGNRINQYPGSGRRGRYIIADFPPGASGPSDPVPVSIYWPIKLTGEYRCVLTKTIYRYDGRINQSASQEPGVPLQLVSPEFKFMIESIDSSYRSPALPPPNPFHSVDDRKNPESNRPGPWGFYQFGFIGVIITALLYLGHSNRKQRRRPVPTIEH